MKKNFEFNVAVDTFSTDKVKDILWQLYYLPEVAFKRLKIETTEADPQQVAQCLIKAYKAKKPMFLFGQAEPALSTEGIDIGIKFPVVRDIVLEHCYKASETRTCPLEKLVKLLKTQDTGDETSMKRIVGGLKAMGFDNDEANYLYKSCNLYPVSLLLEKLDQAATLKNVVPVVAEEVQKTQVQVNSNFITGIVSNKETVGMLLCLVTEEDKSMADIKRKYEGIRAEFDRLNKLLAVANELEQAGISFDELLARKDKVESLFDAINCLAVA